MGLKQVLLETINDAFWNAKDKEKSLAVVHIHSSLANAIEGEGEVFPNVFDPNKFNFIDNDTFSEIDIVAEEQDGLIYFEYEE